MKRIALLLLLCTCRPGMTGTTASRLTSPPEAVDLDPSPSVVSVRLVAERASTEPLRYTYSGTSPGPTIRGKVGDTLIVELDNRLPDPTTLHWHGLSVPYAMDGVTWMSAPVMPGATFRYEFTLGRAGTYWYHPHFDAEHQVDAGLYGALIVEDPREPRADEELILVLDTETSPASSAHGLGRLDTRWTVNGTHLPTHQARGGAAIRARIINASNAGYLALRGGPWSQIGSDQGLLSARLNPARVLLGPGDRVDLELSIGESGFDLVAEPYSLNGGDAYGATRPIVRFEVVSPAPAPNGLAWPFPGGAVSTDPGHTDVVYAFAGSDRTGQWLINGERYPNVTVEALGLGSAAIIELRNLSSTEHPFHLHGLRFEVLSVNGVPPAARTIEDTFNVRIRERVRALVQADNPGEWMAHCHIIAHQEQGMMTVLRVE